MMDSLRRSDGKATMRFIPHLAFVGYSRSGKTTLVSQVVVQLKLKGYRVAVLKHDAHDFQMDIEGKDTYTYGEAGADLVVISSASKLNILEKLHKPLELAEILERISGVDLILIEGYKQAAVPKIVVARTLEQLALASQLDHVIGIASSIILDDAEIIKLLEQSLGNIPFIDINEIGLVTSFVESWLLEQHIVSGKHKK